MEINKIEVPKYRLTLTAEEMTMLYSLAYTAYHDHQIKNAHYFFDKFEDARPAGGFSQEVVEKEEIINKKLKCAYCGSDKEFFNFPYGKCKACILKDETCTVCGEHVERSFLYIKCDNGVEIARGHGLCVEPLSSPPPKIITG